MEKNILNQIEKLPLLSKNALLIIKEANKDDFKIKVLEEIIKNDPVMITKVFKYVNSSALSKGREIKSVKLALSYIGKEKILEIALNSYTKGLFENSLEGYESRKGIFRNHLISTAMASKLIAEETSNNKISGVAYIAGILHDVGKLVISVFLEDKRDDFINSLNNPEKTALDVENELLNTDHTEVGFQIAKKWELPEVFQDVIRYHHEPSKAPQKNKKICYIVHLGNILSMLYGKCTTLDAMNANLDEKYSDFLHMDNETIEKIICNMNIELDKLKEQ